MQKKFPYHMDAQGRITLLHRIINLHGKDRIHPTSSWRRIGAHALHHRLLDIVLDQLVNLARIIREGYCSMDVRFHDQVHVDLNGLQLLAVVQVSVLRERGRNLCEPFGEHRASFVSLGELLRW